MTILLHFVKLDILDIYELYYFIILIYIIIHYGRQCLN